MGVLGYGGCAILFRKKACTTFTDMNNLTSCGESTSWYNPIAETSACRCHTTSLKVSISRKRLVASPGEDIIASPGIFLSFGACHSRSVIARSANDRRNVSSVTSSRERGIDLDVPFIRRSTLGNFAPVESKGNFGALYGWRNDGTNGRLNFWVWKVLFIFNPRPKLCSWLNFAGWRTL